jgi:hypothetical protein
MNWTNHKGGVRLSNWRVVPAMALIVGTITFTVTNNALAQRPESTTIKVDGLSSDVPDFLGTWRADRMAYAPDAKEDMETCGGLIGANGIPLSQCEIPLTAMRPLMHPRLLAWAQFAGPTDEYLSPRYDCAVDSIPSLLGDVYQQTWFRNADKVFIWYEQGNRFRDIWTDGRKHPPMTDQFYMGHSIGWYEGDTFVIDTTNFTFDIDGFDDHTHLPTSHLKHMVERYRKTSENQMEVSITIEDPLFLKGPFTYKHHYIKVENPNLLRVWHCDPETARRELSVMAPDKYEGK